MVVNVFLIYRTKENIPQEMKGKFEDWAFTVIYVKTFCPGINSLNRITSLCSAPNPDVLSMTRKDWDEITEETFKVKTSSKENEIFRVETKY
jgi:epoxyqueuosine reductase